MKLVRLEIRYPDEGPATVFAEFDDSFCFLDLEDVAQHQDQKGYGTLREAVESLASMCARPKRQRGQGVGAARSEARTRPLDGPGKK